MHQLTYHLHYNIQSYNDTLSSLQDVQLNQEIIEVQRKQDDKKRDPDDWIFGMNLMEDTFDDPN